MDDEQNSLFRNSKETNGLFFGILNNIPNPIIITNPDMSISYVNPAFEKLTGFLLSEVTGATPPYLWWPEGKKKDYTSELQSVRNGKKHKVEWCFQTKNGTPFWIKADAAPVKEKGELKYRIASWVDITEIKNLENSLKAKYLRLNRLYSEQIISGKLKLDQRSFRLMELLATIRPELINLVADHKLTFKISALLPEVYIDKSLIIQVLENLVENAAWFSPPSSQISIEAQFSGDWLVLNITDEGQGISVEIQDQFFSLELEKDILVTDKPLSRGLGLPLCRVIVEAHGGRIWNEKLSVKGNRISFTLPVIWQV